MTKGLDPTQLAGQMAQFVLSNDVDGIDVDWEEMKAQELGGVMGSSDSAYEEAEEIAADPEADEGDEDGLEREEEEDLEDTADPGFVVDRMKRMVRLPL